MLFTLIPQHGVKTVVNTATNYTIVLPASLHNKHPTVPLIANSVMPTVHSGIDVSQQEQQWLNTVLPHLDTYDHEKDAYISWAAYHAQSQSTSVRPKARIALLPMFSENANSVAMIKHAMTITKEATEHLNPGQIPVITMDQPLFSLAKQIQWIWPSLSEEHFVVMLGGLHIEMAIFNMLGKWLDGSGWSSALVEAGVTTSGRAAALLSASHVKRFAMLIKLLLHPYTSFRAVHITVIARNYQHLRNHYYLRYGVKPRVNSIPSFTIGVL